MRVVARGDQQDRGGVDPDAVDLEQARARCARTSVLELRASRRSASASSATTRRPSVAIASFVAYMTVSLPAVGRNAAAVRASWSARHVPEPFSQLVGRGEAEMADLVQVLDPHVASPSGARPTTPGSLRHHHRRTSRSPTHDPTTPHAPLRSRRAVGLARSGDAADGWDDRPRSPRALSRADDGPARRHTRRCLPPPPGRPCRTPPANRATRR